MPHLISTVFSLFLWQFPYYNLLFSPDDKESSNEEELDEKEPEEDEDDELVKAIKAAKEIQRDHPPDIQTEDCIVDLCFHPVHDILAVASITGDVYIYNYSNDENQLMATHELHSKACRDIEFSEDGNTLFSCSKVWTKPSTLVVHSLCQSYADKYNLAII